jgi:hypothetical protein
MSEMATQTKTQRQAAARKAAATRKRNAAKQGGRRAKASARDAVRSARRTGHSARTTAKRSARATARRAAAEGTLLGAVGDQARRGVRIPIGAALEARDRLQETVRTWTRQSTLRQRLNRYERRGATALRRNRREVERQVKAARRSVSNGAGEVQATAEGLADRVRN